MKKGENPLSDVTMGLHDGVEVCELVGIYLFGKLSNIIDDNGLSVIENANGAKLDRLRKDVIAIFHNEGLKIHYRHKFNHSGLLRCYLRSIH